MLSIIYSKWYYNWGTLPKADGTPYSTKKGAFRNHPSTKWAASTLYNTAWLIQHGCALAFEYHHNLAWTMGQLTPKVKSRKKKYSSY